MASDGFLNSKIDQPAKIGKSKAMAFIPKHQPAIWINRCVANSSLRFNGIQGLHSITTIW
jgi:hypothetical protein